jgi:hypothetical protein
MESWALAWATSVTVSSPVLRASISCAPAQFVDAGLQI